MSEESKTKLLQEVLSLFNQFGVQPGKGADGVLMSKILAEVGEGNAPPMLVNFNPNERKFCPLCKHPDWNECGCPVDEQMKAIL